MGILDAIIVATVLLLVLIIVWMVWAWNDILRLRRGQVFKPDLSQDVHYYFGRVLEQVSITTGGENLRIEWKLRQQHEGKGFKIAVDCKPDNGIWGAPLIEAYESGFVSDRMRYGDGRVYRMTVTREYPVLWLLSFWWCRTVQFDVITMTSRLGNLHEKTAHLRAVKEVTLAEVETKETIMEAAIRTKKAEEKAQRFLHQHQSPTALSTSGSRIDKMLQLAEAKTAALAKIDAANVPEAEKETLREDVVSNFDHKRMLLRNASDNDDD